LWETHGAPKLDHHVRRYPGLRPRNVTATEEERAAILDAAPPHLRLWILLCSDTAMRSGTAIKIGPEHYDPKRRTLTFTTKYGEALTMPTTADIEAMLDDCEMRNPETFVRQLWRNQPGMKTRQPSTLRGQQATLEHSFKALRIRLGITRRIVPHDLRRTSAVAMYRYTRDVRDVQALLGHRNLASTIWYLDHDLRPIAHETLEAIKRPFIVTRKDRTA
jgi:integrase/recombinase XerC